MSNKSRKRQVPTLNDAYNYPSASPSHTAENSYKTENPYDVGNWYDILPAKFKGEDRTYDREEHFHIKIPFRMVLTGCSGSGKTNALMRLFDGMNCFDRVQLFAKCLHEPLYKFFIDALEKAEQKSGQSILLKSADIKDLPEVDKLNDKLNNLTIIDDMVTEKSKYLAKVVNYWLMSRKFQGSNCFLTQSYFDAPTLIRKNSSYFIFTKISTQRDLTLILKDFRLGLDDEQIISLFREATQGGFPNFFMIDIETSDPKYRFRRNFSPMITDNIAPNLTDPTPVTPNLTEEMPLSSKSKKRHRVAFDDTPNIQEIPARDKSKASSSTDHTYMRYFDERPETIIDRLILEESDQQRAQRLAHGQPTAKKRMKKTEQPEQIHPNQTWMLREICQKLKQTEGDMKQMAKQLGCTMTELVNRLHELLHHGEFDDILYPEGAPKNRALPAGMRMREGTGKSFSEPWLHR